jgi:RimJ/RimL family protein N-acetyltransferase
MIFRDATLDDADLLLAWRNDPTTRAMSGNSDIVPREAHLTWLATGNKRLYIAEVDGVPVGTMREAQGTLSWTIAPEHRGKGLGSLMLKSFIESQRGRLKAEIKPENVASIRMAQKAGMEQVGEHDGLLVFMCCE